MGLASKWTADVAGRTLEVVAAFVVGEIQVVVVETSLEVVEGAG